MPQIGPVLPVLLVLKKEAFDEFQMEQMLLHMGNNCSRLREVKLFNCSVRSDTLVRLGEMCPNITSLSLIWFELLLKIKGPIRFGGGLHCTEVAFTLLTQPAHI